MDGQSKISGVRERNGKIQIDFYWQGKRCRETLPLKPTPKNIKYAAQLRAAILFEISQNVFDYAKYFPESAKRSQTLDDTTMQAAFNYQLSVYERRYSIGSLAKSTLVGYRKAIKGHLIPAFGLLKVSDLSPAHIRKWLSALDCRTKTMRNVLTPLNKVLNNLISDGMIKSQFFTEMNIDEVIKDVGIPKQEVIDPFNEIEKDHLINNAIGQFRNMIKFWFNSGLRSGEIIALRWSNIDFKNKLIYIIHNKVYSEEKKPKTDSGIRKLVMLPKAEEALKDQFQQTGEINDFVFHNPNTNKPWSNDAKIRDHWQKLFVDGIVRYRYPYQCRHSYASMLLSKGENIAWIATQLGHKNTEMVIKNYGKFIPDHNLLSGYDLKGEY